MYKIHLRGIIVIYQYKGFHVICYQPHTNIRELHLECVAIVTRHFARDGKTKSRTKKPPYGVSSETKQLSVLQFLKLYQLRRGNDKCPKSRKPWLFFARVLIFKLDIYFLAFYLIMSLWPHWPRSWSILNGCAYNCPARRSHRMESHLRRNSWASCSSRNFINYVVGTTNVPSLENHDFFFFLQES